MAEEETAKRRKRKKGYRRKRRVVLKKEEWLEYKKNQRLGRKPKLTPEEQEQVVLARLEGAPVIWLAKKFKCCTRTIYRIDFEAIKKSSETVRKTLEARGKTTI